MTWQEFILQLLDRVLWPATVVVALFLFRRPLSGLLPLARKLKYKDLEIEFRENIKQLSQDAEQAFPELKQDSKAALIALAKDFPNEAVLDAWNAVDEAAARFIRFREGEVDLDSDRPYKLIQDLLEAGGYLETKKLKLFSELRQLRNKVAHAPEYAVNPAGAVQYIELCFKLVEHFHELINHPELIAEPV